ncbi:MAG: hypothetical protein NC898_05635 [Candidatus Omnitrophica bacterium]|nr:hypothetical protein [Candidatus Omnitrophota bacterium]MCM8793923.1 hypothetical protein [Candidatus Omnitrophota bacterium]
MMLSKEEKKEMLEMAKSTKLRADFRRINEINYPKKGRDIDLDWYLEFLYSLQPNF